jgi:hypothetical protein
MYPMSASWFNRLTAGANCMYHLLYHLGTSYLAHTVYLCDLYDSHINSWCVPEQH